MRTKTPQQADKMLDAAARLFGGQRFHAVRMEDIASEASVGKGTLYRYFSDKEELYLALLGRAAVAIEERMEAAVRSVVGGRRQLIAMVTAIMAFFDEQPHLGQLIQRAEVMRGPDSPWQHARDRANQIVYTVFADAAKAGDFHVSAPERATQMLLGGVRSVVLFGPKPRVADLATAIVTDFLDGAAG